ncbi:7347_t:CDS:1 [Acaulospora colombiana]|uniref:7347_t:CDS:1 n=1 Tax=Acaulospora colombiana TaxID=27376 RepID=A0ACA9LN25_9GLOM|nr:7347_t:CDS:1 [Acaulospora colombiana]
MNFLLRNLSGSQKANFKLNSLDKSLLLEPENPKILRARGETYQRMGRYEESLTDLNKSLEIEPNNADTLKIRGKTYYMMGKYEEYHRDLNKSLEILEVSITDAFSLETKRGKKKSSSDKPFKLEPINSKLHRKKLNRKKYFSAPFDTRPFLLDSQEENDRIWEEFKNSLQIN